jgi:hypothetical protein
MDMAPNQPAFPSFRFRLLLLLLLFTLGVVVAALIGAAIQKTEADRNWRQYQDEQSLQERIAGLEYWIGTAEPQELPALKQELADLKKALRAESQERLRSLRRQGVVDP